MLIHPRFIDMNTGFMNGSTLSSTELPEAQKEVKSWVPNKSGKACWIFSRSMGYGK